MRKTLLLLVCSCLLLAGCTVVRDLLLPGNTELDKSRRFLDQTSDSPYR